MLTFQQYLMLQSRFTGGPTGARPMDNIPMGERHAFNSASPNSVFNNSVQNIPGTKERMQFVDQDGQEWDMQWHVAAPMKMIPKKHPVHEAVNKEGFHKGLTVYHGTGHKFDHFSDDAPRHKETPEREIKGHFFTSDGNSAYTYAHRSARRTGGKPRVIAAHLHMDNPYNATKEIKKHQKAGMSFSDAKHKAYSGVDRTKHDGVYHDGNGANHPEYVAFHAHQIKPVEK